MQILHGTSLDYDNEKSLCKRVPNIAQDILKKDSLFIWNFDLTRALYFYLPNLAALSQATKTAPPSASHFSSTLNKYPHTGGKHPLRCRENRDI